MADAQRAPHVCHACKLRKKTCDKVLPACGFCNARGLPCRYDLDAPNRANRAYNPGRHFVALPTTPPTEAEWTPSPSKPSQQVSDSVTEQIQSLLYSLDISFHQLSCRYFDQSHQWLPILSPEALFEITVEQARPSPATDTCLLLLCVYFFTLYTSPDGAPAGQLYSSIKDLFSRVQFTTHASIPLIQAGLLLAETEYACVHLEAAYLTMANCAGMARILGIPTKAKPDQSHLSSDDTGAANVAWILPLMERVILADVTFSPQPPMTSFPDAQSFDPCLLHRGEKANLEDAASVGCSPSAKFAIQCGQYQWQVQAVQILDQVYQLTRTSSPSEGTLIEKHKELDEKILGLLHHIMSFTSVSRQTFAGSVALASRYVLRLMTATFEPPAKNILRTLFLLHQDVLDILKYRQTEAAMCAKNVAWAAIVSASKMAAQVARVDGPQQESLVRTMCCFYNLRATLRHLLEKGSISDDADLLADIETMREAEKAYFAKHVL